MGEIKLIYILLCLSFLQISTFPQDGLKNTLISKLVESGIENIAVSIDDKDILVTYENRIFRNEIEALENLLFSCYQIIEQEKSTDFENLILIPQNKQVPLVSVKISLDSYKLFYTGKISGEEFANTIETSFDVGLYWDKLKNLIKTNITRNKIDIVLDPKFDTELDEYSDPIKLRIGIAPSLEISLGQGLFLRGQYIIPIVHKQFRVGAPFDGFRPGYVTLNQTFRIPGNVFLSSTLGNFSNNYYGIDIELIKYFVDGLFSLNTKVGYTGSAIKYENNWDISILKNFTYFFTGTYRIPHYNLSLSINYGQYIYEDKGFRFDIKRQFKDVDIGFYLIKLTGDIVGNYLGGGFYFSVPLFPTKYSKTQFIRFKPADYFSWEYDVNHFVYFNRKSYATGNELEFFIKRLYPDNIITYFRNYSK